MSCFTHVAQKLVIRYEIYPKYFKYNKRCNIYIAQNALRTLGYGHDSQLRNKLDPRNIQTSAAPLLKPKNSPASFYKQKYKLISNIYLLSHNTGIKYQCLQQRKKHMQDVMLYIYLHKCVMVAPW